MKPILRFILTAVILILVMLAVFGAFFGILRCIVIAAVIGLGGAFLYRLLTWRRSPASKQIIDQTPPPATPADDSTQVARQIESRKEHLGK